MKCVNNKSTTQYPAWRCGVHPWGCVSWLALVGFIVLIININDNAARYDLAVDNLIAQSCARAHGARTAFVPLTLQRNTTYLTPDRHVVRDTLWERECSQASSCFTSRCSDRGAMERALNRALKNDAIQNNAFEGPAWFDLGGDVARGVVAQDATVTTHTLVDTWTPGFAPSGNVSLQAFTAGAPSSWNRTLYLDDDSFRQPQPTENLAYLFLVVTGIYIFGGHSCCGGRTTYMTVYCVRDVGIDPEFQDDNGDHILTIRRAPCCLCGCPYPYGMARMRAKKGVLEERPTGKSLRAYWQSRTFGRVHYDCLECTSQRCNTRADPGAWCGCCARCCDSDSTILGECW